MSKTNTRIVNEKRNAVSSQYVINMLMATICIVLSACANPLPPSGGPDDKTPPTIREFSPANATLNYKDKPIEIKFSEYVDKNSVLENVRISPELPLEYSWSGKKLEITPAQKMADNTTYCISLEPNYKDLSGNRPTSAFSVIISTGNTIDSGKIVGKVVSQSQGYSVFAYKIDSINCDTLNIANTKPDYRVKLGSSGDFQIQALKNGLYRLFLVNDRNDDALYNAGFEEFSAANTDTKVYESDGTIHSDFALFYNAKKIDHTAPELNSAIATSDRTLKLMFSEAIDTNSINNKAVVIIDSASNARMTCTAAYIANRNTVLLISKSSMDKNRISFAEIDKPMQALRDSSQNQMIGIIRSELFSGADTVPSVPLTFKSNISDSAKKISLKQNIRLQFTQPINAVAADSISLINNANNSKVTFQSKLINSSIIEIMPINELMSNTKYRAEFKLNGVTSVLGAKLADTTFSINFTTDDLRLYGALSGRIKFNKSQDTVSQYVVVLDYAGGRNQYTAKTDSAMNWSFPALPEGEYVLNVYCDSNRNACYDVGAALPYSPSEKYYLLEKKIKVAQRWKVEDMIIDISK